MRYINRHCTCLLTYVTSGGCIYENLYSLSSDKNKEKKKQIKIQIKTLYEYTAFDLSL